MSQNAIELLKADHEKVRHILAQLSETSSRAEKTRAQLMEKLGEELRLHAKIEEEVFYPALRDAGKKQTDIIYHQCMEEHRAVEELVLPDLESTSVTSDEFTGRAIVLKEMVEHHIREEEEEVFAKAVELFDEPALQELGERLQDLKSSLLVSH